MRLDDVALRTTAALPERPPRLPAALRVLLPSRCASLLLLRVGHVLVFPYSGGLATRDLCKKPNREIRDLFTEISSSLSEIAGFELEIHRDPGNPGRPGKIQMVSWLASSL